MAGSMTVTTLWAADQPNVLFLMSDDLNTALSGFGHPQCKTPELDKLADRGIRFENMHCQYPVCGASRASLMSGLYPYTNGTMGNTGTLRGNMPDVLTMSQLFRKNALPGEDFDSYPALRLQNLPSGAFECPCSTAGSASAH